MSTPWPPNVAELERAREIVAERRSAYLGASAR